MIQMLIQLLKFGLEKVQEHLDDYYTHHANGQKTQEKSITKRLFKAKMLLTSCNL